MSAPRPVTPEEREALYRVYAALPVLRTAVTFSEALADETILLCLRNTLHAQRAARRQRKAAIEKTAAEFTLTPY